MLGYDIQKCLLHGRTWCTSRRCQETLQRTAGRYRQHRSQKCHVLPNLSYATEVKLGFMVPFNLQFTLTVLPHHWDNDLWDHNHLRHHLWNDLFVTSKALPLFGLFLSLSPACFLLVLTLGFAETFSHIIHQMLSTFVKTPFYPSLSWLPRWSTSLLIFFSLMEAKKPSFLAPASCAGSNSPCRENFSISFHNYPFCNSASPLNVFKIAPFFLYRRKCQMIRFCSVPNFE